MTSERAELLDLMPKLLGMIDNYRKAYGHGNDTYKMLSQCYHMLDQALPYFASPAPASDVEQLRAREGFGRNLQLTEADVAFIESLPKADVSGERVPLEPAPASAVEPEGKEWPGVPREDLERLVQEWRKSAAAVTAQASIRRCADELAVLLIPAPSPPRVEEGRPAMAPCFKCGKVIESASPGEVDAYSPPDDAVAFTTYGNFGSTLFDEFHGSRYLEINICDRCLAASRGRVQLRKRIDRCPEITVEPWEPFSEQYSYCDWLKARGDAETAAKEGT